MQSCSKVYIQLWKTCTVYHGSFQFQLLVFWKYVSICCVKHIHNSDVWLNIFLPFSSQLGALDSHQHDSGRLLAGWWSSAKFVVFLAQTCFFSTVHMLLKGSIFFFFMWSAANVIWALRYSVWGKDFFLAQLPFSPCWVKTHLTVDTVICLTAASHSLQTCFLVFIGWLLTILTSFLSAAGDSCFFWSWQWHNCAMHFILTISCWYSWYWDL